MAYCARSGVWSRISAPIHSPLAWGASGGWLHRPPLPNCGPKSATLNLIELADLAPCGIADGAGDIDFELQDGHQIVFEPHGTEANAGQHQLCGNHWYSMKYTITPVTRTYIQAAMSSGRWRGVQRSGR